MFQYTYINIYTISNFSISEYILYLKCTETLHTWEGWYIICCGFFTGHLFLLHSAPLEELPFAQLLRQTCGTHFAGVPLGFCSTCVWGCCWAFPSHLCRSLECIPAKSHASPKFLFYVGGVNIFGLVLPPGGSRYTTVLCVPQWTEQEKGFTGE